MYTFHIVFLLCIKTNIFYYNIVMKSITKISLSTKRPVVDKEYLVAITGTNSPSISFLSSN